MTTAQQLQLARETYQKLRTLLNPKLASIIEHPNPDPGILPKGNHDRVHIRILPVKSEMRPSGFWHRTGCYYEILVGPSGNTSGLCLGSIQFFRYANQMKCGGSKFTPGVLHILGTAK